MRTCKSRAVAICLILLSSSVLLVNGCGRDEAKNEGCPSGSYVANATDSISGPADGSTYAESSPGNPFPGGSYYFVPLAYIVLDSSGAPRNKVCLTFYTDGIWYTDNTYSTAVIGEGPMNRVVGVTDDSGRILLYWSSEVLPPANPVVVDTSVDPPTYTAGSDQTGSSWVQTYSGALSTLFTESWTVQGEPAE